MVWSHLPMIVVYFQSYCCCYFAVVATADRHAALDVAVVIAALVVSSHRMSMGHLHWKRWDSDCRTDCFLPVAGTH